MVSRATWNFPIGNGRQLEEEKRRREEDQSPQMDQELSYEYDDDDEFDPVVHELGTGEEILTKLGFFFTMTRVWSHWSLFRPQLRPEGNECQTGQPTHTNERVAGWKEQAG